MQGRSPFILRNNEICVLDVGDNLSQFATAEAIKYVKFSSKVAIVVYQTLNKVNL